MMQSQAKLVPYGKEPGSFTYVAGNRHVCTQRKVWTARASEAGFTILELIVSLVLMTFVALIIGQGFRIGVNSWDKGEEETLETQKLRILSGMLSQQLKSFYLYKTMLDDDRSNTVLFKGEDDSILFVTSLTDVSAGGLKWVRYSYKDGVLYYKEGLLPDKEVMDNLEGDEEILDADIGEVLFEYYGRHEDEWNDSWDTEDSIPDAVRVKLSYFQPFQVNFLQGNSVKKQEEGEI
jgi:type II secretory pathway component PulJ